MQEQKVFNAPKHDAGAPDTAVQLKTNTNEKKASMLPTPLSIPRPSHTISDDVKEKGEDLGIEQQRKQRVARLVQKQKLLELQRGEAA